MNYLAVLFEIRFDVINCRRCRKAADEHFLCSRHHLPIKAYKSLIVVSGPTGKEYIKAPNYSLTLKTTTSPPKWRMHFSREQLGYSVSQRRNNYHSQHITACEPYVKQRSARHLTRFRHNSCWFVWRNYITLHYGTAAEVCGKLKWTETGWSKEQVGDGQSKLKEKTRECRVSHIQGIYICI